MSQLKNAFARFIESLESRTLLSNAAGTPDVTFGPDGTGHVLTDVGGGASYTVNDMGIDPAGRIIVVGDIITAAGSTTPNDIYVLAYTPNGSLDPTFGVGGKLIINLGSIDSARALLIQPDGKLIIGGFTKLPASNSEDLLVARLNSDGSFDNSFGAGGKTINDISGNDELYDLAFLPDGRFVGSGNAGNSTACHIVQYLANGQLDPSFGTGGIANANYFSDMATGIAVQPSGKILFAGRIYDSGFTYLLNVGRFNSDGTLDTSFKYHQKIDPITSALLTYIVALPDGKFMVSTQGALLRFNADGSHDLTFGSSGIVRGNSGTPIIPGDARGLVMDSAGKFIRVGYKAQFPIHDVAIVRHQIERFECGIRGVPTVHRLAVVADDHVLHQSPDDVIEDGHAEQREAVGPRHEDRSEDDECDAGLAVEILLEVELLVSAGGAAIDDRIRVRRHDLVRRPAEITRARRFASIAPEALFAVGTEEVD